MRADLRRGVLQRWALSGLCILALVGCLLGLVDPVSASVAQSGVRQVGSLVRIATTACLVVVVMLGPGLVWRKCRKPALDLGWVPLPGLGLLCLAGGLAWALAAWVPPRIVCSLFLIPVIAGLIALTAYVSEPVLDRDETAAFLIIACVMGIAGARSLWSLGQAGIGERADRACHRR